MVGRSATKAIARTAREIRCSIVYGWGKWSEETAIISFTATSFANRSIPLSVVYELEGELILNPTLTGYGTWTDMFIGVGVLVASVLLFFYRRIVQDKSKVTFREDVPVMPSAEQMALLREEEAVVAD